MRICVVLSGSMRFHHKSLASIEMLRQRGDVDVFVHTWKDVEDIQRDSWSNHFPATNATPELVEAYRPKAYVVESWAEKRPTFVDQVERWKRSCGLKVFTHYGLPSMFYSLRRAWDLVGDALNYDVYVRLRFDCAMLGGFPTLVRGWSVPDAVDFGGLSDQLAWYVPYSFDGFTNRNYLDAYFCTYVWLGSWFKSGVPCSPEYLLKKSMDTLYGGPIDRPAFPYTIHGD